VLTRKNEALSEAAAAFVRHLHERAAAGGGRAPAKRPVSRKQKAN
jgi:hypothetical protein